MTVFEYVFSLYSLLFGQQASEHRAAGHHGRQGYSRTAARVPPYCKATNAAIRPWEEALRWSKRTGLYRSRPFIISRYTAVLTSI